MIISSTFLSLTFLSFKNFIQIQCTSLRPFTLVKKFLNNKFFFFLAIIRLSCSSLRQAVLSMAASNSPVSDPKLELVKKYQIRTHEVAIAELNHLSSTRAVYQKYRNIFFQTTVHKATGSEQKQLDLAKAKIENLSSI